MYEEMEKTFELDDNVVFKTTCSCGGDNHALTIDLEGTDDEIKTATFYYNTVLEDIWIERKECDSFKEWLYYATEYLITTAKNRLKAILRIIFTGRIETTGYFTFRGDKQILAVAGALIDLVKYDKKPQEANPPVEITIQPEDILEIRSV